MSKPRSPECQCNDSFTCRTCLVAAGPTGHAPLQGVRPRDIYLASGKVPNGEQRLYEGNDPARLRRKADQEWDMAGLARKDGDHPAALQHTANAREYERLWKETMGL